jgi:hypothetical protein
MRLHLGLMRTAMPAQLRRLLRDEVCDGRSSGSCCARTEVTWHTSEEVGGGYMYM